MSRTTNFGRIVVGSEPSFDATFTVAGVATDPTTVTFLWRVGEDGTITTWTYGTDAEITKTGTGEYSVALPVTEAGQWYGRWVGTGTAPGASELTFTAVTYFGDAV